MFRSTRGQSAVETALVMPLTVFVILGVIQLSLMSQARAMTKYAAYRAARAGAMHNACKPKMREAAAAALVPVTSLTGPFLKATTAGEYGVSYFKMKLAAGLGGAWPGAIDVRICGPTTQFMTGNEPKIDDQIDFDDPRVNSEDPATGGAEELRHFERTKLRVQIKYNYRLIIPFADRIIHNIWVGKEGTRTLLTQGLKGGGPNDAYGAGVVKYGRALNAESITQYKALAGGGVYVLPIYASYGLRMQSNYFLNSCPLPPQNECWTYEGPGKI